MRYHALATDYDGTIAHDGRVDDATLDALKRLRESGRRLVLVTGRELPELLDICPGVGLFERVVAENGALVYDPASKESRTLGEPPPEDFVAALRRRKVSPLSVGRSIVATFQPHQTAVLEAIRETGHGLQVIFNKDAVMVLPSGVNKATGLAAALAEMGLSPHNVVAVGDAENDHAFLAQCECAVAVANALPALKERADWVTRGARGAGVAELVERLLDDDLRFLSAKLTRHHVPLGKRDDGTEEGVPPYGAGVMVCGTSGSGKSTLTTGLLERLAAAGYQFAIVDPEGDYANLTFAVVLGSPQRAPLVEEVMDVLRDPARNAVVNLLGVPLADRPAFFDQLLPRLLELRAKTGRPHWTVIDEVHHLRPAAATPAVPDLAGPGRGAFTITVHPGSVAPPVVAQVNVVLAVGERPEKTVREFCEAAGEPCPFVPDVDKLPAGDVVVWRRGEAEAFLVHSEPPKTERKRHSRKYAEGNLGPDRSFYFRGKAKKLNLKCQNLLVFLQTADGVDDATWEFHRKAGDYSRWFRDCVKDAGLGDAVADVEADDSLSPADGRAAVRAAVEERYTLPADAPSGKID